MEQLDFQRLELAQNHRCNESDPKQTVQKNENGR